LAGIGVRRASPSDGVFATCGEPLDEYSGWVKVTPAGAIGPCEL
jgi:hypothetical protein